MRESIFEKLVKEYDINAEASKLRKLFEEDGTVLMQRERWETYSLKEFIDKYLFSNWKYRGTCINMQELEHKLDLTLIGLWGRTSLDELLSYMELLKNMISLLYKAELNVEIRMDKVDVLNSNLHILVNNFGMEFYAEDVEKNIIIYKREGVFTVADEIKDSVVSRNIIKYNHYLLKGKIEEKRSILVGIANEYEAIEKQLKSTEYKALCEDLSYLLNSLNIRHNNVDGKNRKEYICKLSNDEMEELYDMTYEIFLNAIMAKKYLRYKTKVRELKSVL